MKKELERNLSDWYHETNKSLTCVREDESEKTDDNGDTEMKIALESVSFQYHHLRVLLTRHDNKDRSICLQSARESISALDRLVSSSSRVYNGIIWQLLYYPFTPFFTLFGNIIHEPLAPACERDLELLRSTVTYFIRMTSQGAIANKLERIASVFASLAETYVTNAKAQAANWAATRTNTWTQGSQISNQAPRRSDTSSQPIWASAVREDGSAVHPQPDIAMDDFLNWFSPGDQTLSNLERAQCQKGLHLGGEGCISGDSDISGSLSFGTRERPLECDFDWISWDIAGMGPIPG